MNDDNDIVLGVDLGGTKVLAAAVDPAGRILGEGRIETLAQEGPAKVLPRIAALLTEISHRVGGSGTRIAAVGIGVPGAVDDGAGIVKVAPNLPGWHDIPLAQILREHLGGHLRVALDNDVNVALLGEHVYGVGRGLRSMIGVYVGTGIGGGIILGGELHRGERGGAGEVGHTVIEPGGPSCRCGRRGCVEALASRTAMERDVLAMIEAGQKSVVPKLMKAHGKARMTSSIIQRALADRDEVMSTVFRRAQKYVGILCANLVNTLDPQLVVIGGGIAERLGEEMVARIREVAYRYFYLQEQRQNVQIVATRLKADAAPLGAAWVARQQGTSPRPPDSRPEPRREPQGEPQRPQRESDAALH